MAGRLSFLRGSPVRYGEDWKGGKVDKWVCFDVAFLYIYDIGGLLVLQTLVRNIVGGRLVVEASSNDVHLDLEECRGFIHENVLTHRVREKIHFLLAFFFLFFFTKGKARFLNFDIFLFQT